MTKNIKILIFVLIIIPCFGFVVSSSRTKYYLRKLKHKLIDNQVVDILNSKSVVSESGYKNVKFGDYIVGSCVPSHDNTNPQLLKDISRAAVNSNVTVTITTACSGHKPGTRHGRNDAVDIAIVNDTRIFSERNAINKGIHDDMARFVKGLQKIGYTKNVRERGTKKVVLTFGFPSHDNHIHISRDRLL